MGRRETVSFSKFAAGIGLARDRVAGLNGARDEYGIPDELARLQKAVCLSIATAPLLIKVLLIICLARISQDRCSDNRLDDHYFQPRHGLKTKSNFEASTISRFSGFDFDLQRLFSIRNICDRRFHAEFSRGNR